MTTTNRHVYMYTHFFVLSEGLPWFKHKGTSKEPHFPSALTSICTHPFSPPSEHMAAVLLWVKSPPSNLGLHPSSLLQELYSINYPLLSQAVLYNPSLNWILSTCFHTLQYLCHLVKKEKSRQLTWFGGEGRKTAGDPKLWWLARAAMVKYIIVQSFHYTRDWGKQVGVKIQPILH